MPRRLVLITVALALALAPAGTGEAAPPAGPDSTAGAPPDSPAPPPGRVRLDLTPDPASAASGDRDPHLTDVEIRGMKTEVTNGDFDFNAWARYNRVEGIAAFTSVSRDLSGHDFVPAFHAGLGFAFSADRGQYRLGFEQPVAPRGKVALGAEGFRSYLPFHYADEAISSEENSASAFFLHRDYWDWFEAEGLRGVLALHPSPFFEVEVGIVQRDERSLANRTDWSLFNQTADFVMNPAITEGEYRGVHALVAYDSRPRDWRGKTRPRSSWGGIETWYRAEWERGDGGLGGDFDLWRASADLRTYFRISTRQSISTRLYAGAGEGRSGFLPVQRRFFLGGLGTLRGQNYRSLQGDRAVLANLEYGFGLGRTGKPTALFFADAGVAWDEGSLRRQFIPVDVGAGLRAGEITLLVATPVNRSGEAKVYVRFQESF